MLARLMLARCCLLSLLARCCLLSLLARCCLLSLLARCCLLSLLAPSRPPVSKWRKFPDGTDNITLGGFDPQDTVSGRDVLFLASFESNDVTMSQVATQALNPYA